MNIPNATLEKRFEEFNDFLAKNDGKTFATFRKSDFFDKEEGYKSEVHQKAKEELKSKLWKAEDIGSGSIIAQTSAAMQTTVIHHNKKIENNLINHWKHKNDFKNQKSNRQLEQILFDFYKNKIKDEQAFERLLAEKQPYNLIAYLFFIKEPQKYLPISQERFDGIFALLGLPQFKTSGNASWENYRQFMDLIKQVHAFLKQKDAESTLLDAHSFLWILGGKMQQQNKEK